MTKGNAVFKLRKILQNFILSIILVRSFAEFVPMVFEKYGVDFFLSCELNQDPIEEHFGCIRVAGKASDNRNLEQYGHRIKKKSFSPNWS